MASTTHSRTTPPTVAAEDEPRRGLAARVSLGKVFAPVASEFLLILSAALLLTGFGLVMVLAATSATSTAGGLGPYDTLVKQGVFALIGVPLMLVFSRFPVSFWKKVAWPALIGATVLQLLVFVPGIGVEHGGNRNWISIAGYQAQPSEFLKLTLALWLAIVLFRKRTLLTKWQHVFIPVIPLGGLVIATVLAGKDLGTTMVLFLILLAALFFSGVRLRLFIAPLLLAVIAVAGFALTSGNRMARITSFLDPNCIDDYLGLCYQPLHATWGLASGGLFGLGLGNSREKYWLPAAENDYIFAIVGEEAGLIGCVVVLGLFAIFAVGAFHVVRKTEDTFVRIAAGAITVWIVGQALINIGVVLRVFPSLGVPLPFMSQGGTALLSVLMACGVLLSFARSLPVTPVAYARP